MNLTPWRKQRTVERAATLSFNQWVDLVNNAFSYNGTTYSLTSNGYDIAGSGYCTYAQSAYKSDPVVFACMNLRASVFAEARMLFREINDGRPGDLFARPASGEGVRQAASELELLRRPWPGATTGDMLSRMIMYADLGGNAFVARRADRLVLLRPDWVSIIVGAESDLDQAAWDVDAEVIGYAYYPGGPASGNDPVLFDVSEVAHFAPTPDPDARFRGMSWLTPVIREVLADRAFTEHRISYVDQGAVGTGVMKMDVDDLGKFTALVEKFKQDHSGAQKYDKMFLASGMDYQVVGANLNEMDFKSVQGAGEVRIAMAAGCPPTILGLSEGLQGSSLNAGNYNAAKRRFADGEMSKLWRNAAGSLAQIIRVPDGAELWYDYRDIAFLREDMKDAADIRQADSVTIRTLVDGGFDPDSVVNAVQADDFSLLTHTGLLSVQLQDPTVTPPEPAATQQGTNGAQTDGPPRSADLDEEMVRLVADKYTGLTEANIT